MRDYAELVKQLRECGSRRNCLDCPYDNDEPYCIELRIIQAADAIEELLDELTTIRKQLPHWISVEERLPKTADFVLTCSGEYVTENLLCTTIDVEGKHLVWAFCDGLVTHWMPLPEPPKGVE